MKNLKLNLSHFLFLMMVVLVLAACSKSEEFTVAPKQNAPSTLSLLQQSLDGESEVLAPKKIETEILAAGEGNELCNCRFSVISASLDELPQAAYWASGIYFTNINGNVIGPQPIALGGVFPEFLDFQALPGTPIIVETAYIPNVGDSPGLDVVLRVVCGADTSNEDPPLSELYTFNFPVNSAPGENRLNGEISEDCEAKRTNGYGAGLEDN